MRRGLIVLVLLLTAPRFAGAQAANTRSHVACHVDTIGVDTTADSLFVWVPAVEPDESKAEHAFRVAQLRAVLATLRPLPTLGKPDRPPRFDSDWRLGATPVDGASTVIWFQVRDDGRLAGLSVINWSGWDSLDLGLQRAILRADSLRTLQPVPPELAGQGIDLWLGVGPWQGTAVGDVPVAHVRVIGPRFRGVKQRPRLISIGYRLNFPEGAARAGIGDRLLVDFVVDTAGRVEPDSVVFLRASFREYAEEVLKALRSARFAPGRIGECPVRMHVRQPITFAIGYRR